MAECILFFSEVLTSFSLEKLNFQDIGVINVQSYAFTTDLFPYKVPEKEIEC